MNTVHLNNQVNDEGTSARVNRNGEVYLRQDSDIVLITAEGFRELVEKVTPLLPKAER